MDKCYISLIICCVIQACLIVALRVYVIPFGTVLWHFTNTSNLVTLSTKAVSVLSAKMGLRHYENVDIVNGSSNTNKTPSVLQPDEDTMKADRFLICQIPSGRLGNQMFDFASGLGIAHALNYKFVMRSSNPLLKYFELNQTLVEKGLENVKEIPIMQWRQNTWNKTNLSHNLTLQGYWRIWKYFDSISDNIRTSFTIKPKFLNVAKKFIQSHNPNNTALIGVHVRRGDFLSEKSQRNGRVVVNKIYLLKAMQWFRRNHKDARFVVVSDDNRWCRDNIQDKDVIFSTFTEPIYDMAILSLCNHTVMSTGTFSWWGAWLAGGEVIYCSDYPRQGSTVANHALFRDDFYPPSWIGMTNGI